VPGAGSHATDGCQACGACCSFSAEWPRFTLEEDEQLDAIPDALVSSDRSGMSCSGDRCSALTGVVGKATACSIYGLRPDVCRACVPGGEDCRIARDKFGLSAPPTAN
jgi:Fe-S-cluster containining protein